MLFWFGGDGWHRRRLQQDFGAFFPGQAPVTHGGEDGAQGFAFAGQLIGAVFGAIGWRDLSDDASGLQALEAVAEDICGNAFRRRGEIFEARFAQDEIADDEEGPAVTEDIETTGERTGRAAFGFFRGFLGAGHIGML